MTRGLRQLTGNATAVLRPEQRAAVRAVLAGRDVFVQLATGAGKSVCYALPPLVRALQGRRAATAVVVSPLISLMADQCARLRAAGVAAGHLAHVVGAAEVSALLDALHAGRLRVLFVTPERALAPGTLAALRAAHAARGLALLAVDEAHCVAAWGPQFRPEYARLGALRAALPGVPLVALTATAPPPVRAAVAAALRLRPDALHLVASCDRPNVFIEVRRKGTSGDPVADLSPILRDVLHLKFEVGDVVGNQGENENDDDVENKNKKDQGGNNNNNFGSNRNTQDTQDKTKDTALVYVPSVRLAKELASTLPGALGCEVAAYHGEMDAEERERTHKGFREGRVRVVVATSAFGMGIDAPHVRAVVCYGAPLSLEALHQQLGRAGRDGRPARGTVLWAPADYGVAHHLINAAGSSAQERARLHALLEPVREFLGDTVACRRALLLAHLGERLAPRGPPPHPHCCDTCAAPAFPREDLAAPARTFLAALARVPAPTIRSVARALHCQHQDTPAASPRPSPAWWEELGLRLLRAGFLEHPANTTLIRVTPAGTAVLRDPQRPVLLPLTDALRAELPARLCLPAVPVAPSPVVVAPAAAPVTSPQTSTPVAVVVHHRRRAREVVQQQHVDSDSDSDGSPPSAPLRCGRALPPSAKRQSPAPRVCEYPCEILFKQQQQQQQQKQQSQPLLLATVPSGEPTAVSPLLPNLAEDPAAPFSALVACFRYRRG